MPWGNFVVYWAYAAAASDKTDVARRVFDRFAAAANTPEPGLARRALGRVLRPTASAAMRLLGPRLTRAKREP